MIIDSLYNMFSVLYCLSFPLWIPAAIGLYLLTSRRNDLSPMAGFLTLKPIITTPIWAAIISFLYYSGTEAQRIALWSILAGTGLTVLAIVIFRRLFLSLSPRFILAVLLILLDCMRWINSGLLTVTVTLPYNAANNTWANLFALIGLIFPSAYAIVALTTTLKPISNKLRPGLPRRSGRGQRHICRVIAACVNYLQCNLIRCTATNMRGACSSAVDTLFHR